MKINRGELYRFYREAESEAVKHILNTVELSEAFIQNAYEKANTYVVKIREAKPPTNLFKQLLLKYSLSTEEGLALMCLAEALMRIPDKKNQAALIEDKIAHLSWRDTLDKRDTFMLRLFSRGLHLASQVIYEKKSGKNLFRGLLKKLGQPTITLATQETMKILSQHFVMAEKISTALKQMDKGQNKKNLYSFDMLGEAARTQKMADDYKTAYYNCLEALKKHAGKGSAFKKSGVSIKLSALHPRFHFTKRELLLKELLPVVLDLFLQAKKQNTSITIDAEEADRLYITLDILEGLVMTGQFKGWQGISLVVQAYQKRALALIDWVQELSKTYQTPLGIRLVKGAYWDTEIKLAQQMGEHDYPVYTKKHHTDLSYLACAQKLLKTDHMIYPQFATHNAYSVAAIQTMASKDKAFEFQRLYGMGEELYDMLDAEGVLANPCRVYAPIGAYKDLLPYLVRRLLENGANNSFVNRLHHHEYTVEDVVGDPFRRVSHEKNFTNKHIVTPPELYGSSRKNAATIDIIQPLPLKKLKESIGQEVTHWPLNVSSIIDGVKLETGEPREICPPHDPTHTIGGVYTIDQEGARKALRSAYQAFDSWNMTPVAVRRACLLKAADILEEEMSRFIALLDFEGGKTILDAIAEIREAVDFCRYYAHQAATYFSKQILPGPTGETNELWTEGRGVFVCVSPWNFPLAIFTGQIVAALVAGNSVIAKAAEPTTFVASEMVKLLHRAGIPQDVLQFVVMGGRHLNEAILSDPMIGGVAFTGSTNTAWAINQTLAARPSAIVPFIAETGGVNAMIVDSSSLLEQVADAAMRSAFQSAGQRCSALRLMYVQEDIFDECMDMIKGVMDTLQIGDPIDIATDVGPVINTEAKYGLLEHIEKMKGVGELQHKSPFKEKDHLGSFVPPHLFALKRGSDLKEEAFGPILHVVPYQNNHLDAVIEEINRSHFGLTLGIQTRIMSRAKYIAQRVRVGNIYVNRDMIGAVVGTQPFGGQGLSGTGPKAGGPHYLARFMTEKTFTDNIMAAGGNPTLLNLEE